MKNLIGIFAVLLSLTTFAETQLDSSEENTAYLTLEADSREECDQGLAKLKRKLEANNKIVINVNSCRYKDYSNLTKHIGGIKIFKY